MSDRTAGAVTTARTWPGRAGGVAGLRAGEPVERRALAPASSVRHAPALEHDRRLVVPDGFEAGRAPDDAAGSRVAHSASNTRQ